MGETDQRLVWIANILGVRSDRLSMTETDTTPDVFLDHTIRVGYFHGNIFWRENPISRSRALHGWEWKRPLKEGSVSVDSEPQYDLVIHFNFDGSVRYLKDERLDCEGRAWLERQKKTSNP